MILQQYYEERGTLVAEARSILDSIANETDQTRITEAEQRHDAVMAKSVDGYTYQFYRQADFRDLKRV